MAYTESSTRVQCKWSRNESHRSRVTFQRANGRRNVLRPKGLPGRKTIISDVIGLAKSELITAGLPRSLSHQFSHHTYIHTHTAIQNVFTTGACECLRLVSRDLRWRECSASAAVAAGTAKASMDSGQQRTHEWRRHVISFSVSPYAESR